MQHWLAWWPTLIVLAVATFTDLRSRRIPNWLVLPFLLAGIVVSPLRMDWSGIRRGFWLPRDWSSIRQGFWPGSGHSFAWHGLGQSCAGLGLGFLLYGLLFWMGGMGAGDLKLCTAIGILEPSRSQRGRHMASCRRRNPYKKSLLAIDLSLWRRLRLAFRFCST